MSERRRYNEEFKCDALLETELVEAAWHMARIERQAGRSLLHHTDRGSRRRYQALLAGLGGQ